MGRSGGISHRRRHSLTRLTAVADESVALAARLLWASFDPWCATRGQAGERLARCFTEDLKLREAYERLAKRQGWWRLLCESLCVEPKGLERTAVIGRLEEAGRLAIHHGLEPELAFAGLRRAAELGSTTEWVYQRAMELSYSAEDWRGWEHFAARYSGLLNIDEGWARLSRERALAKVYAQDFELAVALLEGLLRLATGLALIVLSCTCST